MLLGAVVAGGAVGAISTAHFAGTSVAQLATITITAVSVALAVCIVMVAVVGFLIGRAIAAEGSDAAAAASGLVGAALLGAVTLVTTGSPARASALPGGRTG